MCRIKSTPRQGSTRSVEPCLGWDGPAHVISPASSAPPRRLCGKPLAPLLPMLASPRRFSGLNSYNRSRMICEADGRVQARQIHPLLGSGLTPYCIPKIGRFNFNAASKASIGPGCHPLPCIAFAVEISLGATYKSLSGIPRRKFGRRKASRNSGKEPLNKPPCQVMGFYHGVAGLSARMDRLRAGVSAYRDACQRFVARLPVAG